MRENLNPLAVSGLDLSDAEIPEMSHFSRMFWIAWITYDTIYMLVSVVTMAGEEI